MNDTGGEATWHRCAPVLPRSHLSVRNVRAQGGAHRAEQPTEATRWHQAPTRTRTSTLRWGVRAQGGVCMDRANGTKLCMPELPRPHLSVGIVRATRQHAQWAKRQRHEASEGWGDATDVMNVRLLQDKHWSRYGDIGKIRPGYDSPGA